MADNDDFEWTVSGDSQHIYVNDALSLETTRRVTTPKKTTRCTLTGADDVQA